MSGKCVKEKEVLRVTLSKVLRASYYQGFATSFSSVKRFVKTLKKNMIGALMIDYPLRSFVARHIIGEKRLLIKVTQQNNGGIYLSIVRKQKKRGYLTLNLVVDVVVSSLKQQMCQCYEDFF